MNRVEYDTEGVLFNIQRYSLHDGPGIRTIPFLKAVRWPVSGAATRNHSARSPS